LQASVSFPEAGKSERRIEARLMAGDIPVTLTGSVGTTPEGRPQHLDAGRRRRRDRLCDWSLAEQRQPDGSWQRAPDALTQLEARPVALKRQLEGVAKLARGEPHQLATLEEALNVQEIVEAILAS
jgi:predicted dehydrogenase